MSEKKENTPKLRFPGFTDAWEKRELGEVIDNQYNGQTPSRANTSFWNGDINWLSSGELNRGVVSKTIEKITEDGRKNANLKIVPKGTFVMAITGLEASGTRGNCAKLGIDTTLNQSCMALYPNEKLLNSSFLFQWYRKVGEEYGLKYTQGTKQQSYNAELIKILPINLPSVSEQIQIADFLDTLDHLIILHQRKLKNARNLKVGLLQTMFPKNGEDFPEVRFHGFTDAWEQRRFNSVFDLIPNNTLSRAELNYDNGKIKSVHYGDILIKYGAVTDCGKDVIPFVTGAEVSDHQSQLLQDGDVLIADAAEDETVGKATEITGITGIPVVSGLHTIACRPKVKMQPKYLGYYMNSPAYHQQLLPLMQGIKVLSISRTNLAKTIICYPTSAQEQSQIGKVFADIDHLITLHQRKLEHLQQQKKSLLQQMFV